MPKSENILSKDLSYEEKMAILRERLDNQKEKIKEKEKEKHRKKDNQLGE